jgi:hypothetical protein
MPISWNEIRHNAIKFSRDWAGVKSERAEKQTFWNEFFQVFGLKRRVVASTVDLQQYFGWRHISNSVFPGFDELG